MKTSPPPSIARGQFFNSSALGLSAAIALALLDAVTPLRAAEVPDEPMDIGTQPQLLTTSSGSSADS